MEQVMEDKIKSYVDIIATLTSGLLPDAKVEFGFEQAPPDLNNKIYVTIKIEAGVFE